MNFIEEITKFRETFEKFDYQLRGEQEIIKEKFLEEILSYKRELNFNKTLYENLAFSESLEKIISDYKGNLLEITSNNLIKGANQKIISLKYIKEYSKSYKRLMKNPTENRLLNGLYSISKKFREDFLNYYSFNLTMLTGVIESEIVAAITPDPALGPLIKGLTFGGLGALVSPILAYPNAILTDFIAYSIIPIKIVSYLIKSINFHKKFTNFRNSCENILIGYTYIPKKDETGVIESIKKNYIYTNKIIKKMNDEYSILFIE